MIDKYGGKMGFVACDAALGYSEALELKISKEPFHLKLIISEIIICVGCCRVGGHMGVKIYSRRNSVTHEILAWLAEIYETVEMRKLETLRLANSETFIICRNLKKHPSKKWLYKFIDSVNFHESDFPIKLFNIPKPTAVTARMKKHNTRRRILKKFFHQYAVEHNRIMGKRIYEREVIRIKKAQMDYAKRFFKDIKTEYK
jgi:hypothetical protein